MNIMLQLVRTQTISNGRIYRGKTLAQTRIRRPTSGGASGSGSRPFSVLAINSSAGTVTFSVGYIIHGMTKIDVAAADVGIGGGTLENPSYVGVEYTYGGTAAYLPNTTTNMPLPTLTAWKQPIASFYRLSGKIYLKEVLWDSIIILPGITSPS